MDAQICVRALLDASRAPPDVAGRLTQSLAGLQTFFCCACKPVDNNILATQPPNGDAFANIAFGGDTSTRSVSVCSDPGQSNDSSAEIIEDEILSDTADSSHICDQPHGTFCCTLYEDGDETAIAGDDDGNAEDCDAFNQLCSVTDFAIPQVLFDIQRAQVKIDRMLFEEKLDLGPAVLPEAVATQFGIQEDVDGDIANNSLLADSAADCLRAIEALLKCDFAYVEAFSLGPEVEVFFPPDYEFIDCCECMDNATSSLEKMEWLRILVPFIGDTTRVEFSELTDAIQDMCHREKRGAYAKKLVAEFGRCFEVCDPSLLDIVSSISKH